MRLIDADALTRRFKVRGCFKKDMLGVMVHKIIDTAPTIDAVPVVRCKDCVTCTARKKKNGEVYFYWCVFHDMAVEENDFCSHGERKDGEEGGQ